MKRQHLRLHSYDYDNPDDTWCTLSKLFSSRLHNFMPSSQHSPLNALISFVAVEIVDLFVKG
jgi:hypothetical protein